MSTIGGSTNVIRDRTFVDYKIIEIPLGIRHYMFLNDNSSLFANLALVYTHDLSDFIVYENNADLEINTGFSLYFGVGFELNKKISIEGRVYSQRETLTNLTAFKGPFNSLGLVLGYQFL